MLKNKIIKDKNGKRRYQVTINGKRHVIYQRKNELVREFEKRCEELDIRSSSNGNTFNITPDSTFSELFNTWYDEFLVPNNSKADITHTKDTYRLHVEPALGIFPLYKIDKALVYKFLTNKISDGYSKSMVSKIRGCISRPFNWATTQLGLNLISPTEGIRLKHNKSKSTIRVISDYERDVFFEQAKDTKYYNYFKVLYLTGLRPSEGLGLQKSDIVNNNLHINRGITSYEISDLKTESGKRIIPITSELQKVLNDQLSKINGLWLFPSSSNDQPSMNAVTNSFKRIQAKIKPIHFNLYDFRHTFATHCAEMGVPFNVLQKLMGHKDINVTLKYYIGISQNEENQMLSYLNTLHDMNKTEKID